MKKYFKLALAIIGLSLFLVGCAQSTETTDTSLLTIKDSGKMTVLEDLSYDWKDINIEGGTVSKNFKLKNISDQELILKGAQTSCMCTEATYLLPDGTQSPAFGMHENTQWAYSIKPNEEFEMEVVFDPMAHGKDAVGPITRSVYLFTSSEDNGNYAKMDQQMGKMVTELKLEGNVLSKDDFEKLEASTGAETTTYSNISPEEFDGMLNNKDFFLVDVHIPEQEHIQNTDAFIAYNEIDAHLEELPKDLDTKVVVYCRSGSMSQEASQKLIDLGYKNVFNLTGGKNAYEEYKK